MRLPRFPRWRILPFALAFAFASSFAPASAASVIATVRIDGTPAGGAIVSVSFTGGLPPYHLVGAGTPETAVLFDTTTLGQVAPSIAGIGPVGSLSVAQTGASSSIALHLTSATGVRVRGSGSNFYIDVSPVAVAPAANPFGGAPATANAIGIGPQTEVVLLKYADVSEIAGVLSASANVASNDTFAPYQTNIGTSSLGGPIGGVGSSGFNGAQPQQSFGAQGGFGQAQGVAQRVNDNIAIDRRLNAMVLSGTPEVIAGLKAIIEKLDVPVRSVILETEIVELSDTAARDIGFDFSGASSTLIASGASAIKNNQQPTSTLNLAANLYAQVALGNAKIIAKPRILAQSGQAASILTGDAIPVFTNITSGNNSPTVQQVNYINVGVNLQIQPRVSSDGFVTSHIYSEVSSVTNFINTAPQISQRTASTVATVRDGESFVIGGLLQDNEIRNLTKLPFIGDVPVLGLFFRRVTTSHTQTNLYIVVTPRIVGPSVRPGAPPAPAGNAPAGNAPAGNAPAGNAPASPAPR